MSIGLPYVKCTGGDEAEQIAVGEEEGDDNRVVTLRTGLILSGPAVEETNSLPAKEGTLTKSGLIIMLTVSVWSRIDNQGETHEAIFLAEQQLMQCISLTTNQM